MKNYINVQGYLSTITAPWTKLFYKLIWHNLDFEGKKILDFGSGLGLTANYLALKNEVVAIEPNEEMILNSIRENNYVQICGDVKSLAKLEDQSFDTIICHNVFEYLEGRKEVMREFSRVLKPGGVLSIVKHNRLGKIMQKAIFEYKVDEALKLINNEDVESINFGMIREYENSDLEMWCENLFDIDKIYGIRTFFALQKNELKTGKEWIDDMFRVECAVQEIEEFQKIAFFHHILMKKLQ
jgi:SAM-dependent methyltransferase